MNSLAGLIPAIPGLISGISNAVKGGVRKRNHSCNLKANSKLLGRIKYEHDQIYDALPKTLITLKRYKPSSEV